jgi:AcrR family transcriptional regulator
MPRPASHADQRLIRAAIELIPETGFSGLSLRRVAAQAGVNLGLFPYYFKDKRSFLQRVMQEFYEEFYRNFSLEISAGQDPEAQLRRALASLARFARDHRKLLLALLSDLVDGEPGVVRFLQDNFPRHVVVLLNLIRRCQRARVLRPLPVQQVLPFLLGSLLAPNIVIALAERTRLRSSYELLKRALLPGMLCERVIGERIELALRALAPTGGQGEKRPRRAPTGRS